MTGSIAVVYADAALFGMDGTLTDSIGAVETLSAKVAAEIVADLEASSTCLSRCSSLTPNSAASTPYDSSEASTSVSSRAESFSAPESLTFAARLTQILTESSFQGSAIADDNEEADALPLEDRQTMKLMEAWQPEVTGADRSVRILPGVRAMLDSIPEGRYAIATSNIKTYAYGCLARVGVAPPAVTITTDDPRLKAGKPSPDPFLLAAECLGYDARRCVVFEDSPTGIHAGLAAGAIVIAVRTGRSREDVAACGAHFVVDDMERVQCRAVERDGEECLEFSIELQDGEDELLCF